MSPITRYKTRPYQIDCDECGEHLGSEEYGGPILFDSHAAALETLADWSWQLDGKKITCEACIDEKEHAAASPGGVRD